MIFSTHRQTMTGKPGNLRVRLGRAGLMTLAMLCLVTTADSVLAQVQVTAIWVSGYGYKENERANELDCRHDDYALEKVYPGMYLKEWDEISAPSGTVYVELKATNGDTLKGWGDFNFVIKPAGPHFVIEGKKGGGECQCPGGSKAYGEAAIHVIGTEYSVSLQRTPTGLREQYAVFEGGIDVHPHDPEAASTEETVRVGTGQKVLLGGRRALRPVRSVPGKPRVINVTAEDISKSASVYAAIDTAKATRKNSVDPKETYVNFVKRYEAVFSDPKNADNRLQLAIDQVNLDVNDDAIYQLQKAEKFAAPQQNTILSVIAVTSGAAYAQKGDKASASKQIDKARALNPSILEEDNLRLYRLNDKTRSNIRQVKVLPFPARDGIAGSNRWPVPLRLTTDQRQIIDLINAGKFNEAYRFMGERNPTPLGTNSIDDYLVAIIKYELKEPDSANLAAYSALKKSAEDKLLSKDVYAAAQKIYETTRPR